MEETPEKRSANVLSPSELVAHRITPHDKTLPGSHGDKVNLPSASDGGFQNSVLKLQYSERKSILQEERVTRVNAILFGHWIETDKVVLLTKKCGDQWSKMGFSRCGKDYLYPEEALFLTETGRMEVKNSSVPMSIQEMYAVMLNGEGLSLEKFQVYSHLTRLGYFVTRSRQNKGSTTEIYTEYEKQLGLHNYPSGSSKRKRQESDSFDVTETVLEQVETEPCKLAENNTEDDFREAKSADDSVLCLTPRSATQWHEKIAFVPCDQNHSGKESKFDQPCLRLLLPNHFICDVAYTSRWTSIRFPSKQLLPESIANTRQYYDIDLRNLCRYKYANNNAGSNTYCNSRRRRDNFEQESLEWRMRNAGPYPYRHTSNYNYHDLKIRRNAAIPQQINTCIPFGMNKMDWKNDMQYYTGSSTNSEGFYGTSKYKGDWINWKQFKAYLKTVDNLEILQNSAGGHLWRQSIKPLLLPQDCTTKASVMERLSLTEQSHLLETQSKKYSSDQKRPFTIDFDVYSPHIAFKRNVISLPNHRVKVLRALESVPDIRDVVNITAMQEDSSPLYFAVVNNGAVKFFFFNEVNIPHVN